MARLSTTTTIAALLFAISAVPGALAAQASTASKSTTTITIEVDPWLAAWKKDQSRSQVQRISKLSDSVERSLLRCLSSR
jgi:hypothetical protein